MKRKAKTFIGIVLSCAMISSMGMMALADDASDADYSILDGTTISYLLTQSQYYDAFETMADAIEEDYGCSVEFQVVPDDQYYSLVNLDLSTGEVPDVLQLNCPEQNGPMDVYDYCEDLSDEPWVSRLVNKEMLEDPQDGKIYALPKESSSGYQVVYYNKDLLDSCGVTDVNPQTYDEFLDILQAVKDNSDAAPFLQTNADSWETQIFMTGGIAVALGDSGPETFEKLLNNEIAWTDIPETEEILQKYIDLYDAGYVNEDHLSVGYDDAAQIMADGKAAMYLTVDQWATDFTQNYPDIELGSFVIPYADEAVLATGSYVQGIYVPNAGSQVDAAKTFLQVWSLPEYQNLYYEEYPGYPAFDDVDGGDATPCVQSIVDEYITTGNYVYEMNSEMGDATGCFTDLWNFYIEAAAGEKSVASVWEDFEPIYVDYMATQGYEAFE